MGILSDRTYGKWGMRKPFIVFGYILWGIITAVYPMIQWIQYVGTAVVFVVITDAVMTFFGSTSNDAAYNAWLRDISSSSNRNRIQSINNITGYLANAIALVAAGFIIDSYGYFVFFYALGGFVTITGVISVFLIPARPNSRVSKRNKKTFAKELINLFDPNLVRENRTLFLLFVNMALGGIAGQVYFPYILIFLENYAGFTKSEMSFYLAIYIVSLIFLFVLFGLISHRFNRKPLLLFGTILNCIFTIGVGILAFFISYNETMRILVFVMYFIASVPSVAASIAHGGWLLDKYPNGEVGKFQGIRMIFMVLIPMVVGPFIGAAAINKWGITVGSVTDVPTPHIFIIGGFISILAIIPILFIPKSEGKIKFEE
jgi:Na+/melibiose symporter-like transporter